MKFKSNFAITVSFALSTTFCAATTLCAEENLEIDSAEKKVISYLPTGLLQKEILLKKSDSTVFFYNDSQESGISVEVEVKGKTLHCASQNMKVDGDYLKTKEQIKPGDFAAACFPDAGNYNFQIMTPGNKTYTGLIKVIF